MSVTGSLGSVVTSGAGIAATAGNPRRQAKRVPTAIHFGTGLRMPDLSLTELSLFSGYGGFTLGLRLAGLDIKTVGYVEIDEYCQQIIQARIQDGLLDYAPILRDIREADFRPMAELVDIITASFPCQPFSVAGQRRGETDERNLWPDTLRVVREVGPRFVLLENVPGLLVAPGYAGTVVGELAETGYDCFWGCISAATVGAPHLRWRWWCLAYARQQHEQLCREGIRSELTPSGTEQTHPRLTDSGWWAVEPPLGRVAHGVAHRVDRLRALGNGIVPAVVKEFLR